MAEFFSKYGTLVISIVALIATFINIFFSVRFSRKNVLNNLHQLALRKSADCNKLWDSANDLKHMPIMRKDIVYGDTVSEVIISLQLLDECLSAYNQPARADFLEKQFWIQLSPGLRYYIKAENPTIYSSKTFSDQITTIQSRFGHLFENY